MSAGHAHRHLRETMGTVYFIEAVGSQRVKIGWTSRHIVLRLDDLQTGSPFPLRFLAGIQRVEMRLEAEIHAQVPHLRVDGKREWFHLRDEVADMVSAAKALRPRGIRGWQAVREWCDLQGLPDVPTGGIVR